LLSAFRGSFAAGASTVMTKPVDPAALTQLLAASLTEGDAPARGSVAT